MALTHTHSFLQSVTAHIDARNEKGEGRELICKLAYKSRYPEIAVTIAQAVESEFWTMGILSSEQSRKLAEIVISEGKPSQARRFVEAINGHLHRNDWRALVELIAECEDGVESRILLDNADFRVPKPCEVTLKISGMRYRPRG